MPSSVRILALSSLVVFKYEAMDTVVTMPQRHRPLGRRSEKENRIVKQREEEMRYSEL